VLMVYAKGEPIKAGSGRVYYLPGPLVGKIKLGELGPETAWAVPMPGTKLNSLKPGLLLKTH